MIATNVFDAEVANVVAPSSTFLGSTQQNIINIIRCIVLVNGIFMFILDSGGYIINPQISAI